MQSAAARGDATEHTFRPALKALLEALDNGDDLLHSQRVVVALAETRRIMAAIDARIGAWLLR